jgi:hypothetical protein
MLFFKLVFCRESLTDYFLQNLRVGQNKFLKVLKRNQKWVLTVGQQATHPQGLLHER